MFYESLTNVKTKKNPKTILVVVPIQMKWNQRLHRTCFHIFLNYALYVAVFINKCEVKVWKFKKNGYACKRKMDAGGWRESLRKKRSLCQILIHYMDRLAFKRMTFQGPSQRWAPRYSFDNLKNCCSTLPTKIFSRKICKSVHHAPTVVITPDFTPKY